MFTSYSVNSRENEFGTVKGWVRIGDGEWQNATVHDTLKVFEPFEVKVEITTKQECHVDFSLTIPGKTVSFQVIDGPSQIEKPINNMNRPQGWTETYEWTVRPNDQWTDGHSPLNIFVQFTETMDNMETEEFTLIRAFIEDEVWDGYVGDSSNDDSNDEDVSSDTTASTPGFELILFVISIVLSMVFFRNRKL